MEQLKGFCPEWEATWRRRALGSVKVLLQMLHSYGFSPLSKGKIIYMIFWGGTKF